MREKFSEYYLPTNEEFQELWKSAHFIFDANTLLNLYMYTEDTVNDYWKALEAIKDRIWISYQAGLEFHRNRPSRIIDQENLFDQTLRRIEDISEHAIEVLENHFENVREHPSIEEDSIVNEVKALFKSLKEKIETKKENYPNLLHEDDPIIEKISELFSDKIGEKFDEDKLEKIYKDGEVRFKNEVPTGFEDAKSKKDYSKFGDLIIWKEVLEFAKTEEVKGVVFVTNDLKKDWWQIKSGRTIGPHPSLIKEFKDETGKRYYQYSSEQFLKFAKDHLVEISSNSIDETKKLSEIQFNVDWDKTTVEDEINRINMLKDVLENSHLKIQEKKELIEELIKMNKISFIKQLIGENDLEKNRAKINKEEKYRFINREVYSDLSKYFSDKDDFRRSYMDESDNDDEIE